MRRITNEILPRRSKKDDSYLESEDEYIERVKHLLPNFPDEVLISWLYRHESGGINRYGNLGIRNFRFERLSVSGKNIMKIRTIMEDQTEYVSTVLDNPKLALYRDSWLVNYMVEHKTFPTPIIVLNNNFNATITNGILLQKPCHLMEGHKRLAIFRGLYRKGDIKKDSLHDIFLVNCDPSKRDINFEPLSDVII